MATFTIDFNFTTAAQQTVLTYLQTNNYNLVGFKGAIGPNQIASGVPTWFVVPFTHMFGQVTIDYTPTYKVFVFNQGQIAAQTIIQMQALSVETPLGNALTFNQNGSFTSGGVATVPSDSIGVFNASPGGNPPVTVGLAGLVQTPDGNQFLPFCAFTFNPQAAIIMRPLEQVLLMAAQISLQSGNVQANLAAPGALFAFSAAAPDYPLMIAPSTYAVTNQPGTTPVTAVSSGASVALINAPH
jgi:hypothetical protein